MTVISLASIYKPDSVLKVSEGLLVSIMGILVVMLELALLAIFILLMAKVFKTAAKRKKADIETAVTENKPIGTPLDEKNSEGKLDLIDVDEPTAAVIMAIVSEQSGIPLNRLSFNSIRKMEENNQ
ncbi:MAG: OadG family protein [Clostridia bacterium]|nr:OadG family protein [Clostridia bacterium]